MFGNDLLLKSQFQRFNIQGQTNISLNTGYVNEDFNKTIEELFLSENIWLVWESNKLAAIPKTKSFRYRTNLNNKLINYTISFDFSFDTINSVR